jgi:hypothetical protein
LSAIAKVLVNVRCGGMLTRMTRSSLKLLLFACTVISASPNDALGLTLELTLELTR